MYGIVVAFNTINVLCVFTKRVSKWIPSCSLFCIFSIYSFEWVLFRKWTATYIVQMIWILKWHRRNILELNVNRSNFTSEIRRNCMFIGKPHWCGACALTSLFISRMERRFNGTGINYLIQYIFFFSRELVPSLSTEFIQYKDERISKWNTQNTIRQRLHIILVLTSHSRWKILSASTCTHHPYPYGQSINMKREKKTRTKKKNAKQNNK